MSNPVPWSADGVLEITSEENVPETGMQVEIDCAEVLHDPDTLYCHCRQPWTKEFMIMCENCRDWFHGICVSISENEALDIDLYHCSICEPLVGKTIYKKAGDVPIAAGSELFISKLKERVFVSADEIITRERGHNLNLPNLFLKGFNRPIVVDEVDGLGIKLPPETITVRDIERFVGPSMAVEVIEVEKQSSSPMTLRSFIDYFTSPNRIQRLNLISLEVSDTSLGQLIEPPYIARKLDWVLNTWPQGLDEELFQRPKVSKYCLIGSKDSYTDFHIDFGGTSVWYHVLWGEKVFYLIEPTDINILLYEKWMSSSPKDKFEAFFGDTVDYCYKLVLKKGQTLFIPTGWIHAVLTTMDSLVFGGNFLHILNMDMQLKIYNMEKKLNIKRRYMFPSFEIVHWLAAQRVIQDLNSCNEHGAVPLHLRTGTKTLIRNLELWIQGGKKAGNELVPPHIDTYTIIKLLNRELKHAEKRLVTSMPKPAGTRTAAAVLTAELLSQEPSMTSFSGFLLDDFGKGKRDRNVFSSPSQDEMSPSRSPPQSAPRIKLKLKKEPSGSISTQSSPSYSSSMTEDGNGNGNPLALGSNGTSQSPRQSPQDSSLKIPKIRLSLSESRVEVMGSTPKYSAATAPFPHDHSDSDTLQIDTDGENTGGGKRKCHHGHRKKCKNHRKRREEKNLNEALQGTLNGMEYLIDSSDYHDRVQANQSLDPAIKEAILDMKKSDEFYKERLHKKKHKRKRHRDREDMDKVHQDDDYIYPSLMASDDDEDFPSGSSKRSRKVQENDVAWCPGVKVTKLIPKTERPGRPSAKREAVEKGLTDAATKLASNDALKTKRKYKPRSPNKSEKVKKEVMKVNDVGGEESLISPQGPIQGPSKFNFAVGKLEIRKKKFRKGMATPKQRLSKILKINKLNKF